MAMLYILFSEKLGRFYIGSTQNLERRMHEHNRGQTRSTRSGVPWSCAYTESYATSKLAKERELQLKRWKSSIRIRELIQSSAG